MTSSFLQKSWCRILIAGLLLVAGCSKAPSADGESSEVADSYEVPPIDDTKMSQLPVELLLSNPVIVDQKHALRVIEVTGLVTKAGKDSSAGGVDTVWLGPAKGKSEASVACRFRHAAGVQKASTGKTVTIRGQLQRDMAQSLEDCEVVVTP